MRFGPAAKAAVPVPESVENSISDNRPVLNDLQSENVVENSSSSSETQGLIGNLSASVVDCSKSTSVEEDSASILSGKKRKASTTCLDVNTTTPRTMKREKLLGSELSRSSSSQNSQSKLVLQRVQGDGNCLFRAVALQVYGDENWHDRVREECMDFMVKDKTHFEVFIDGDFEEYVRLKRQNATHGDNPEIQALAELYNRPIMVYATQSELTTSSTGSRLKSLAQIIKVEDSPVPFYELKIFHDKYSGEDSYPIRLCYLGQNHYDAAIDPFAATVGVGLGLAGFEPGKADRDLIKGARLQTDVEATEEELNRAVLIASLEEAMGQKLVRSSDLLPPKKRQKKSASRLAFPSDGRSSSSSAAVVSKRTSESWDSPLGGGELSSSVRELVLNGFPLNRVLAAQAAVGDSFEDMLNALVSDMV